MTRRSGPTEGRTAATTSPLRDRFTAASMARDDGWWRGLTGCASGCGADGHEPGCGLDQRLAAREERDAAWDAREREHRRRDREAKRWKAIILGQEVAS